MGGLWNIPISPTSTRSDPVKQPPGTLINEPIIWNSKVAYAYAAVAPDKNGDLGGTVMWGGGTDYENCGIIVHDGYTPAIDRFWRCRKRHGRAPSTLQIP